MSGETVGQVLDRALNGTRGPRSITVDHGTEFQSRALEDWAYREVCRATSFGPANLWKTPSLRLLTDDCAMNVWTCTSSRPSLKYRRRLKRGGGTIRSVGSLARSTT
jgi:hypothetical protein